MSLHKYKSLPPKLKSEINKLHSAYSGEISVNRNKQNDMMIISHRTIFKSYNIKIVFKFDINNIASTIKISLEKASRKYTKLPAMAADFLTSMLIDKFNEKIDNKPIYACVQFFDREFACVQLKNSKTSVLKTTKQKRITKQFKEQKQNEAKRKVAKQIQHHGQEYIIWLHFTRLLEGAQHKKENNILSQLNDLRHSSTNFFAYFFYGTPGIICLRSTSKVTKKFVKYCSDIGKKTVITHIINQPVMIMKYHISKNTVTTRRSEAYNRSLIRFLDYFKLENKLKVLDIILAGNRAESQKEFKSKHSKSKQKTSNEMYVANSKYEFNIELGIRHQYDTLSSEKGNLRITIFGQNDNKLIEKYKLTFQRWRRAQLKFEFSSIDFLNKIGNLNRVYIENFSKNPWKVTSVNIGVYQVVNGKNKKNRIAPVLKKEYVANKVDKWINSNSSFSVNVATKN